MIEVVQYETQAGDCLFGTWFEDLDAWAAAKVRAAIARIETGNFGDAKPVGEGVSERRIDFGPARGRNEDAATARHRTGQGVLAIRNAARKGG